MRLRLFILFILFSTFVSETFSQTADKHLKSSWVNSSVVAYSQDFAKRFALPDPEPGMELKGPLKALQFRVEPSRYSAVPGANLCLLSVYLDARVPLHFPTDGPSGSETVGLAHGHFFVHPNKGREHWLKLALEDRRHFGSIQSRFTRNAALATEDYERPARRGGFESVDIWDFHRELFPSLTYLRLNLGCPFPRWVGVLGPTQLWLKRQGGKDYTRIIHYDPQDFERFELPRAFVEGMAALERGMRSNLSLVDPRK